MWLAAPAPNVPTFVVERRRFDKRLYSDRARYTEIAEAIGGPPGAGGKAQNPASPSAIGRLNEILHEAHSIVIEFEGRCRCHSQSLAA
jgi:hypothetical protein